MSSDTVEDTYEFVLSTTHRHRKVSKSVWAMASAVARAYNGGPQRGSRGQSPR